MSEWISVEDRLPEIGVPVLVYMVGLKNPHVDYSRFDNYEPQIFLMVRLLRGNSGSKYYWNHVNKGNQLGDRLVSHWMPLPPPPKA